MIAAGGNLSEIIPCFACGRTFVYKEPKGEESGRFCSDNCRQAYDAGFPTYTEPKPCFDLSSFDVAALTIKRKRRQMADLMSLAKSLQVSPKRIVEQGDSYVLSGRHGHIDDDGNLYIEGRTKRHFSGIKRQLGFMDLASDQESKGSFQLKKKPSGLEADYIRKVLGLKKSPGRKVHFQEVIS